MAHKTIFSILKKYCQLWVLIIVINVMARPIAMAAEFSQVSLDNSDFLLLDITLQQRRLLASIEAYQSNEQTLLPVNLLINSLGAGVEVDLEENTLLFTIADTTIVIELDKETTAISLPDDVYYWAKDDYELYLSQSVLAALLKASINVQLSRLNVEIKSLDDLFPIEKNWQRSNQLKESEDQDSKEILYVADTYQLFTPPTADVSLSIGQQSEDNFNGSFSLQSSADVLYHSADISLFKSLIDDEIISRVEFTRHQSAPDTPLLGGLNEYSFGDITSGGSALYSHSSSGLGFKFSRRPENISQNFGSQNIEGNATPGWEAELHKNGFLIETIIVPANGRYIFQNVTTDYGNNNFEVRLFGPFGEEDVRRVNLNIGSNWLPKGEFSYSGYMLNANKTLLNGDVDNIISDSKEDYGISLDYSPFDNTHMGYFYQHVGSQKIINRDQESRSYMGTHIQSALSNLLIDIEYVQQQDRGHRVTAQGIGQFPSGQNYNVVIQEQRDFSTTSNILSPYNYQASFSTNGTLPIKRGVGYRAGVTYTGAKDSGDSWLLNSSFGWRFSNLHFSETLNYRINNFNNVDNSLTGNLTVSSTIANIRLRTTANYFLSPTASLSSINLGASWRASQRSYHNLNSTYEPKSKFRVEDKWRAGYTYSTTFEKLRLYSNVFADSQDKWAVSLGINFFFDYDAHNDEFIMSSQSAANAGHLNVTSYLDRNDNNRRDEGDWLLDDIAFSPLPSWQDRKTNESGQVTLSGVPVYTPVTFTANPNIDVATKQPNYTIYTHPGSRVNIEIPFTIKTNIIGFVEIEGGNGEQVLTTGTMILINQNTNERTELTIDIDGFYETPGLNAGHYSLHVSETDLARLKLVSKQGTLSFATPSLGGDYELPVISLLPITTNNLVQESTTIFLNEDNGEAFYFGEDTEADNIYVNPWQPSVVINGEGNQVQLQSIPNYKTDSAQPLVTLAPSSSGNEAMRAESTSALISASVLVQPPSSIASDDALRAEAAGNFIALNNQTQSSQIETQIETQPDSVNKTAQYFTIQVGAFSESVNADSWLQKNSDIAFECSTSKPNKFYVVDCGYFEQRTDALQYQLQLAQQQNIQSSMIKTVNTVQSESESKPIISSETYSIQLIVASQASTLNTFINRHNLDINNIFIKDKIANGRVLKALSYGRYSSKVEAQQAISTLPIEIQQKTWITEL